MTFGRGFDLGALRQRAYSLGDVHGKSRDATLGGSSDLLLGPSIGLVDLLAWIQHGLEFD